jgi:hypothetical protein
MEEAEKQMNKRSLKIDQKPSPGLHGTALACRDSTRA